VTTGARSMQPTEHELRCAVRRMGTQPRVRTNGALQAALERTEREAVEKMLARTNGNVAEAAAMLGILRTSLYRIMKRCGIASPSRPRN
jgi:transcriptional regulator of acetoin/glycerol metabolism